MMTFNMESLTEEEPAPGHWGQVVSELRLSSEQMKSCKAAMHIFIEQMSAVMKEREQILKSLQDKLHGSPAIPDSGIPAGHMYVELYVLMQALAANVAKERGARDTVIQFIGYGAFDHTTNAALMARSYP